MLELQDRQKWKKKLYSKPAFAALIVLTFLTAKGAWNVYAKSVESRQSLAQVRAEVEALRDREAELSAQLERLETSQGVEEEIRKKFSVVREGEEMVVLVDEETATTVEVKEEEGFFKRVWKRVRGVFGGDDEG